MAAHPVRWFMTNRFIHIRSYLGPSLEDRAVPALLRERLTRRIDNAIRLAKMRILLFALLYAAIIGPTGALVANYLAEVFGSALFAFAGQVFGAMVAVAAFLAILGLLGIALANRALAILEAEIYVLGMEVVARCVKKGDANLPSRQYVRKGAG